MADPSRRRNSGPIVNSGTLSKQKSPVANDPSVSKDAMVKYLCVCSDFSKLCVDQLLFIDQIEKVRFSCTRFTLRLFISAVIMIWLIVGLN